MVSRRRAARWLIALTAGSAIGASVLAGRPQGSSQGTPVTGSLKPVKEHRYRMAAGIRPLLLFWMSRDNVGGARVVWLGGENESRGLELLIGSDPVRAPTRVNRWGYIREEVTTGGAAVTGLMTDASEQSLDEVKKNTGKAGTGPIYKIIKGRTEGDESTAETLAIRARPEWSYRDLAVVLSEFEAERARRSARTGRLSVPAGTQAGLLMAIADVVNQSVKAIGRAPGSPAPPGRRTVIYTFNAKLYELRLVDSEWLAHATFAEHSYRNLLQLDFEVRNPKETWREKFSLAVATDGPLAGVPVHVTYQPRWWFRAELFLDERETF
jgi:hypothetical protein